MSTALTTSSLTVAELMLAWDAPAGRTIAPIRLSGDTFALTERRAP